MLVYHEMERLSRDGERTTVGRRWGMERGRESLIVIVEGDIVNVPPY